MVYAQLELTAGGKTLAEVKIQSGMFQRDVLLLIQFVIVMMPFSHILRKGNGNLQGATNFLNHKKRLITLYTRTISSRLLNFFIFKIQIQIIIKYSQDTGMEFSIKNTPYSY